MDEVTLTPALAVSSSGGSHATLQRSGCAYTPMACTSRMIFIETQAFTKLLNELMAKEDYRSFQNELVANPTLGDVIKDTGGLRKVRVGAKGKGKRRGARVIYLYFVSESQIAMLYIYSKNEETDLTAEQCKVLKEDDIELEETGMSKFFEGLLESVQQVDEIVKGARTVARNLYRRCTGQGDSPQDRPVTGQVHQAV